MLVKKRKHLGGRKIYSFFNPTLLEWIYKCVLSTGTGAPKKVSDDTFGDLLGSQGFNFTPKQDTGPKTINQMKKAEMAREMDPDKLKVSGAPLEQWPSPLTRFT